MLVQAVYAQLNCERPAGLHYGTFRLPDGVSFMHITIDSDQPGLDSDGGTTINPGQATTP